MEEKVLVESKHYNAILLIPVLAAVGLLISLILMISGISAGCEKYDDHEHRSYCYTYEARDEYEDEYGRFWEDYVSYQDTENMDCDYLDHSNSFSYGWYHFWNHDNARYWFYLPFFGSALIGGLIYLWLKSYSVTVTDKRVFGKVVFGKRVDLPVDSISSTATIGLFHGVSVATSSGMVKFLLIKNANEIYETISKLVIDRQPNKTVAAPAPQPSAPVSDEADKLAKFKALLDDGVITEEEFNEKKKQLLGL